MQVVVRDSLSSIHSRRQNNVEDVRDLLIVLIRLADAYQVGMFLHHIRKPDNGQNIQIYRKAN